MADYNANCKIVINDVSDAADSVSGSLAADVIAAVNALDSTSQAIIDISVVKLDRSRVAYIILYT
tara:strand:- start:256 stop:450 length:195 start_codon:yes stop_codon:yes gene_type:complete